MLLLLSLINAWWVKSCIEQMLSSPYSKVCISRIIMWLFVLTPSIVKFWESMSHKEHLRPLEWGLLLSISLFVIPLKEFQIRFCQLNMMISLLILVMHVMMMRMLLYFRFCCLLLFHFAQNLIIYWRNLLYPHKIWSH